MIKDPFGSIFNCGYHYNFINYRHVNGTDRVNFFIAAQVQMFLRVLTALLDKYMLRDSTAEATHTATAAKPPPTDRCNYSPFFLMNSINIANKLLF